MNARLFIIIIIMVISGFLVYSMAAAGESNTEKEIIRLREAIDKALVQVYALEGSYPADLDHLVNYGIIIDRERYFFHYEVFAINLKPAVIIVLR